MSESNCRINPTFQHVSFLTLAPRVAPTRLEGDFASPPEPLPQAASSRCRRPAGRAAAATHGWAEPGPIRPPPSLLFRFPFTFANLDAAVVSCRRQPPAAAVRGLQGVPSPDPAPSGWIWLGRPSFGFVSCRSWAPPCGACWAFLRRIRVPRRRI
jgi:hypothetical protein